VHDFLEEQRCDAVETSMRPLCQVTLGAALTQNLEAFEGRFRWSEAFLFQDVQAEVRVSVVIKKKGEVNETKCNLS